MANKGQWRNNIKPTNNGNSTKKGNNDKKKKKDKKKSTQPAYQPKTTTVKKPPTTKPKDTTKQYQDFLKDQKKGTFSKPKVTNTSKPDAIEKLKEEVKSKMPQITNTTYLGTQQKETTTKLASDKKQKKIAKTQIKQTKDAYYKSQDWADTKAEMKRLNRKAYRQALRDAGYTKEQIKAWMQSDKGKAARKESYMAMKNGYTDENGKHVNGVKDDINKSIRKSVKANVKDTYNLTSVNALTKGEFDKMVTASAMGKIQGNKFLKGKGTKVKIKDENGDVVLDKNGKPKTKTVYKDDLRGKVGAKTAESAYKSKGATGVMQGLSYADVFSGGVGTYDKASAEAIRQTKDSKSYLLGYGLGMAGQMAMGGIGSKGASLAGMIGKESAKEGAKLTTKEMAKGFAKRGVGELVAETPTNIMDAAKMSMDEKGNIDKDSFRNWMLFNSALTSGMGRGIEGIGGALTKKQVGRATELLALKKAGKLTAEQSDELAKLVKKISKKTNGGNSLSKDIARNGKVDIRGAANDIKWSEKAAKTKGKGFIEEQLKKEKRDAYYKQIEELKKEKAQKKADAEKYQEGISKGFDKAEDLMKTAEWKKAEQDRLKSGELAGKVADEARSKKSGIESLERAESKLDKAIKDKEKAGTLEAYQRATNDEAMARADLETARDMSANSTTIKNLQNKIAEVEKEIEAATIGTEKAPTTMERMSTLRATRDELMDTLKAEQKKAVERINQARRLKQNGEVVAPKTESGTVTPKAEEKADIVAKTGSNEAKTIKSMTDEELKSEISRLNKFAAGKSKHANNLAAKGGPHWTPPDVYKLRAERDETNAKIKELEAELHARTPEGKAEIKAKEQKAKAEYIRTLKDRLKTAKESLEWEKTDTESGFVHTQEDIAKAEQNVKDIEAEIKKLSSDPDATIGENLLVIEKNTELEKQAVALESEAIRLKKELGDLKGGIPIAKVNGATEIELNQMKAERQELSKRIDELQAQATEIRSQKEFNKGTEKWQKNALEEAGIPDRAKIEKNGDTWSGSPKKETPSGQKTPIKTYENEADIGAVMYKQVKAVEELRDKTSRGFFNSFRNWDKVVASIDNAFERNRLHGIIQNVRMSKSTAMSKVATKFAPIYKDYKLNIKGNGQKLKDFEEYAFLKHNEERLLKDDTGFMAGANGEKLSLQETRKRIEELESQWGHDADGVITEKGEIQQFQKRITQYFNDLLDEDVRCGFDTAENVSALKEKWDCYVPTFRDVDELASYPASNEIHFGNVYAVKGGVDRKVMGLLDQAIEKTAATTKRAALNDMMNAVAQLNGVRVKDLPRGKSPEELLTASTLTFKGQGKDANKFYVQYWEDGVEKALEINEGMYKGLRQWSGEDKLFFMNIKLAPVEGFSKFFKAWITDYSLVFGARNFIRDIVTGLFYTQNPIRYAKNIPRGVACVLADTKIIQKISGALPQGAKDYIETYANLTKVYKENGGAFSQLVTSTNPEKAVRKMCESQNGVLSLIKEMNSSLEMIPRMTEFCTAIETQAIKESKADWKELSHIERRKAMDVMLEDKGLVTDAMYRAKEVTLNFDRSGYIGRWLNSGFVPFFNPAVQGLSKLGRVLSKSEKSGSDFAKMLAMFGGLGLGSEAVWQMTIGQTEEYQKLSDYNKTGYACFPLALLNKLPGMEGTFSDDACIKIPKAREVAALQGGVQWAFQHMVYHCAGKDEYLMHSLLDVDLDFLNKSKSLPSRIMHPVSVSGNVKTWWEQIGPVSPLSDNLFYAPFRIAAGKNWYGGFIESFEDEDYVASGKSYKAYDEETSAFSIKLSKILNEGVDKLGGVMGWDKARKLSIKQHIWSPKKLDDLFDSYLGGIYDMTIKQTSLKNHSFLDAFESLGEGSASERVSGFGKNIWGIIHSPFGNAFMVDTVLSNRYRQDAYQLKSDIKEEMYKITNKLGDTTGWSNAKIKKALIKEYGINSPEYNKWMRKNAQLTRLSNSFLYTSSQYDEMMASIYTNQNLNGKQKKYWVKEIKKMQNALLVERQDGKKFAGLDPMKWAYEATRQNGKKLFTTDQVIEMCSYAFKGDDGKESNIIGDAYKKYIAEGGKAKNFMSATLEMREVQRRCGDSLTFPTWQVAGYVAASKQATSGKRWQRLIDAYGVYDDSVNDALNYFKNGNSSKYGKASLKTFIAGHKRVVQYGIDNAKYVSQMDSWDMVNALASSTTKGGRPLLDRSYYAEGYYPLKTMNAGRCLFSKKYGKNWTPEKITKFCELNGFTYKKKDKDGKTIKPNPDKVASAIKKEYGGKVSTEEMAAVFEEICPYEKNPFGSVGNYSVSGDTGIQYSGRGGHGHRRHGGGGGGGGGAAYKPATFDSSGRGGTKLTDVTFKSTLNDAYRKKLKKRIKGLNPKK